MVPPLPICKVPSLIVVPVTLDRSLLSMIQLPLPALLSAPAKVVVPVTACEYNCAVVLSPSSVRVEAALVPITRLPVMEPPAVNVVVLAEPGSSTTSPSMMPALFKVAGPPVGGNVKPNPNRSASMNASPKSGIRKLKASSV